MERAYFQVCRALGRLLRSVTYSRSRIVSQEVRKHRAFYAPLLIWLSGPLVRILDAGVRVLPQKPWEERERAVYRNLHGASIRIENGGVLVLPRLPGATLASLLEGPALEEPARRAAIERAVTALARFHDLGFTHADAMAENVMVDPDAGVAHWFDFETVHVGGRTMAWRRADDLRALLSTCLLRTPPDKTEETLRLIVSCYPNEDVTALLKESFASAWRRSLIYHLSQAALPLRTFQEIARLLRERDAR